MFQNMVPEKCLPNGDSMSQLVGNFYRSLKIGRIILFLFQRDNSFKRKLKCVVFICLFCSSYNRGFLNIPIFHVNWHTISLAVVKMINVLNKEQSMFLIMEQIKPLFVLPGEHIPYLFTTSMPTCQFAWQLVIPKQNFKNLDCKVTLRG